MTFEVAWRELDMAMWVNYNELFNQADADDAALARAQAKAQAKAEAKAQAKAQPKAKAKVQAKAKAKAKAIPKAHPKQSARPHADALARAWAQQMPGRIVPSPASPVNPSPALGPSSSSSSAGGVGF